MSDPANVRKNHGDFSEDETRLTAAVIMAQQRKKNGAVMQTRMPKKALIA